MNNDLRALLTNLRTSDVFDLDLYNSIINAFLIDQRIPDYKYIVDNDSFTILIKKNYYFRSTLLLLEGFLDNINNLREWDLVGLFYIKNSSYLDYKLVYKKDNMSSFSYNLHNHTIQDQVFNGYGIEFNYKRNVVNNKTSVLYVLFILHDVVSLDKFEQMVNVMNGNIYQSNEEVFYNLVFYNINNIFPALISANYAHTFLEHSFDNFMISVEFVLTKNNNVLYSQNVLADYYRVYYYLNAYKVRENLFNFYDKSGTRTSSYGTQNMAQNPYEGIGSYKIGTHIKSVASFYDNNTTFYAYTDKIKYKGENKHVTYSYVVSNTNSVYFGILNPEFTINYRLLKPYVQPFQNINYTGFDVDMYNYLYPIIRA